MAAYCGLSGGPRSVVAVFGAGDTTAIDQKRNGRDGARPSNTARPVPADATAARPFNFHSVAAEGRLRPLVDFLLHAGDTDSRQRAARRATTVVNIG